MTLDLTFQPLTVDLDLVHGEDNVVDLGPVHEADHQTIQITIVDAAGDPVDVSAWTTRTFSVFNSAGAQAFTMSPAFATDGTNGRINIALTNTQLTGLGGEDYTHEMQVSGTGIKMTAMRGRFKVIPTYI